jgi:RimJ/RimL family protein N-acetyltransferase
MLRGDRVVLRAVRRDDVPLLHAWEHDHDEWPLVSDRPYVPCLLDDALRKFDEGELWRPDDDAVPFAVAADDGLVGHVMLYGIDTFNRRAHLGIGLGPEARGKGYGSDACRVLLRYAFVDRGLHRVQLEVLADNEPALRSYRAAGFVEDGRMRESAWVSGGFVDEIYMSALATDQPR